MFKKDCKNKLLLVVYSDVTGYVLVDPDEVSESEIEKIGGVKASIVIDDSLSLYDLGEQIKDPYETAIAAWETRLFDQDSIGEYLDRVITELFLLHESICKGDLENVSYVQ